MSFLDAAAGTATLTELFDVSEASERTQTVGDRTRRVHRENNTPLVSQLERELHKRDISDATLTVDELQSDVPYLQVRNRSRPVDDLAEGLATKRAVLLSRLTGSQEDDARFALLTQRLRKLSPRVTEKDFAAMTEITSDVEGIVASIARIDDR